MDIEEEKRLIMLARSGDRNAFNTLIKRHSAYLFRQADRFLKNKHDTDDVLQEVYMTVYQKLDQFEGRSSFKTWITSIVVNASKQKLQQQSKDRIIPLEDVDEHQLPEDEDITIDDQINTEQSLAEIEKAVVKLPLEFMTVVVLKDIEGFTIEEAAEIMEISEADAKSKLHRARLLLRKRLKDLFEETTRS